MESSSQCSWQQATIWRKLLGDIRPSCVNWSTVHLVLTLSILHNFKSRQANFIQAFTQAPLDCPIFMEDPAGYSMIDGMLQFTGEANQNLDKSWVLQLTKNMYALKQAGHNMYNQLQEELLSIGIN